MSGLHSASQKTETDCCLSQAPVAHFEHFMSTALRNTRVSSRTDLYSRYQLEASAAIARLVIQVNACWCRLVDEDMLEAVR